MGKEESVCEKKEDAKIEWEGGFLGYQQKMRKAKPPKIFATMDEMLEMDGD
jgi:hypothetical protein